LELTNVGKFVFILLRWLYGSVGLCLGGFVLWFLGFEIVDKWFYFQNVNVFLCLNTITGLEEGRMWDVWGL
jgi:hypothetical protein